MATYQDMARVGDEQLRRAEEVSTGTDGAAQTTHPDTFAEMTRLTGVLARHTDLAATPGVHNAADEFIAGPSAPTADTTQLLQDAARQIGDLLWQAQTSLAGNLAEQRAAEPAAAKQPSPAAALHLRGATIAFGHGLDLLNAHGRAQPDVARTLLDHVGAHATRLAQILHAGATTSPQLRRARNHLSSATAISQQLQAAPPAAIQFPASPDRIPLAGPESSVQAAAGVSVGAQRLAHAAITGLHAEPPGTARYLATSSAVAHHLAASILSRITQRLRDLGAADVAATVADTISHVRAAGAEWADIASLWSGLGVAVPETASDTTHATGGVAIDAGDLVVRLGRIVHLDPAWTPSRDAASLPAPAAQVVPGLRAAAALTVALHRTVDAFTRTAAGDIATRHHPTQTLTQRYHLAHRKGRTATVMTSVAALALAAHAPDDLRSTIEPVIGRPHMPPTAPGAAASTAAKGLPRTPGQRLASAASTASMPSTPTGATTTLPAAPPQQPSAAPTDPQR